MNGFVEPRRALQALLNVAVGDEQEMHERAQGFAETYGALRGDCPVIGVEKENGSGVRPETDEETRTRAIAHVCELAQIFSQGLGMQTKSLVILNRVLSRIFQERVWKEEGLPGALHVDFATGTVEPRPRDLLDALALELIRGRKSIIRCAVCSKFFYRQFSKDKYCSPDCATGVRRKQQLEWITEYRAEAAKKQKRKH